MKQKPKGRPFLEVFASAVQEDYRFPLLEIFAFLYALSTFVFAGMSFGGYGSSEQSAYSLVSALMSIPLNIFMLLVFKNIAFGLGSDLEKGTIQTTLSYPLKRHAILTAKLLSAIGVALLLLFGIQILGLTVVAAGIIREGIHVVILTYVASLGYPLLLSAIILFVALWVKKGGLALVLGIVMSFAFSVIQGIALIIAMFNRTAVPFQILAIINPSMALQYHYSPITSFGGIVWNPSLIEVVTDVCACYALVALALALCYYYFSRRLNL